MKFLAVVAVAALPAAVSAAACDYTKLASDPNIIKIIPAVTQCQAESGYTIIPPVAMPTAADTKAICSKCTKLIADVKTATLPDCDLTVGGETITISKFITQITTACASGGATTAGSTAGNTTAVTTAPGATTAAPGATPAAAAGSNTGSGSTGGDTMTTPSEGSLKASSGSGGNTATIQSGTKAPTKTPVPTTKKPSAGVVATFSAAVAVACSIAAFAL